MESGSVARVRDKIRVRVRVRVRVRGRGRVRRQPLPGGVQVPLCQRELLRGLSPRPRVPPLGGGACVGGVPLDLERYVVLLVGVGLGLGWGWG